MAELEIERRLVDPLVGGGEGRLVLAGDRVALDQIIPDQAADEHALADALVELDVVALDGAAPADVESVVLLSGPGRAGRQRHGPGKGECDRRPTATTVNPDYS